MSIKEEASNCLLDCKSSESNCLSEETKTNDDKNREVSESQGIGRGNFNGAESFVDGEMEHSAPSECVKLELYDGSPPGSPGRGRSGSAICEGGQQVVERSASLDQEDQWQEKEEEGKAGVEDGRRGEEEKRREGGDGLEEYRIAPRRSQRKRKATQKNVGCLDYSDSNRESDEEDFEVLLSSLSDTRSLVTSARMTRSKEVDVPKCLEMRRVQRLKRSARPKRRCDLGVRWHGTADLSPTSESSESELEKQTGEKRRDWSGCESPVMGQSSSDNDYFPPTKRSCGHGNVAPFCTSLSPTLVRGNILANVLTDIPEVDIVPMSKITDATTPRSVKQSPQGLGAETQVGSSLPGTHPHRNSNLPPTRQFKSSTVMVGEKKQLPFPKSSLVPRIKPLSLVVPVKERSTVDKLNLRKTADRRSRANVDNSGSAASTLSLKTRDQGSDSKAAGFLETGASRGNQEIHGKPILGSKQRVKFGTKSRNKDSHSTSDAVQWDREEDEDGMTSTHFKVLKSWESDVIRGKLATRGPMLYALDKFPQIVKSDGPWMRKAKMIWTIWRHKVPLKERLYYTEKARLNRIAMFRRHEKSALPPRKVSKASSTFQASKVKMSSSVRVTVPNGAGTLNESSTSPVRVPRGAGTLNESSTSHIELNENPSLRETECLITESQSSPAEFLASAGSHEDRKEFQAIAVPCEDHKELPNVDSVENHKELQATVGSLEDHKELQATVGSLEDHKELQATVDSVENHKELQATVGSLEDHKELQATVGSLEDHKELQATVGSLEDHKELQATVGSLEDHNELQATAGSLENHKELQATVGSLEDHKEFQATAGSLEDHKELQATAGSLEDHKELQATVGSLEDHKDFQATVGSLENHKEFQATAGSLEDHKELQATVGYHKELQATSGSLENHKELPATVGLLEDHKELQATVGSLENHKELQATSGSLEDHKELQATVGSLENHKEFQATVGSPEDHKELQATVSSLEDHKELQATSGSLENHKELQATVASHVDRKESQDTSKELCDKRPAALLDLLLPCSSTRTTSQAGTTPTTVTTAEPSRRSGASNIITAGAKKATLVKVDLAAATIVPPCDTTESILVIERVSNAHAARCSPPPPKPCVSWVKPTKGTTGTSDKIQSSLARSSTATSPVQVGILLKEALPPMSLLDECCKGVKKTMNPYGIATPTQINTFCTSPDLLKDIAPLSPEKEDQSLSFPSSSPEANFCPSSKTRRGIGFGSRGNSICGISQQAPSKPSKRQRCGSESRKSVSQSPKDGDSSFSAAGYSITTMKRSSASVLASSFPYQPTKNSRPITSRSVPATPTRTLQGDSQRVSPHLCPRMPSHVSSFVIPQMPAPSAPMTSLDPCLPTAMHESVRKVQGGSFPNSLKMHQNRSMQTQSGGAKSSPTNGRVDHHQSFSVISPNAFNQSRALHDKRSRSVSTSSSALSSPSPTLLQDVSDSSLMGGENNDISSQPVSANHHCLHKHIRSRNTVHHMDCGSPLAVLEAVPGSPCNQNLKALQGHSGDGCAQGPSGPGRVLPAPSSFTNLSLARTDSSQISNSKTSKKDTHLKSVTRSRERSEKAGRVHRVPTTIGTTASGKPKSGRMRTCSFPSSSSPLRAYSPKAYMKDLTEIKLTPSSVPTRHFQPPLSLHQRPSPFPHPSSLSFSPPQTSLASSSLPCHPSPFPQTSSLPPSAHSPFMSFQPQSSTPSSSLLSPPSSLLLAPPSIVHSQYNTSPDTGIPAHQSFGNPSPFGPAPSAPNIAVTKMSKWELEQLYYYNIAVMEQHKLLMKTIEDRFVAMEGEKGLGGEKGLDALHSSSYNAYKRFLDFTVEPYCNLQDDGYDNKFGFGGGGKELSDLILGGTPGQPIINSKYDIYANAARMHQNS